MCVQLCISVNLHLHATSGMCLEGCNLYTEHSTAQLAICAVNQDTGDHLVDPTCCVLCRVMLRAVMGAVGIRAASDCLHQQRASGGMSKCELKSYPTVLCLTDTPRWKVGQMPGHAAKSCSRAVTGPVAKHVISVCALCTGHRSPLECHLDATCACRVLDCRSLAQ